MGKNFYKIMKKNCELKECLFSSKLIGNDLTYGSDFFPYLKSQEAYILIFKRKYKKAEKIILKLLKNNYQENIRSYLIQTFLYLSIKSKDIVSAKIILRVILLNPRRLRLLYQRTLVDWVNSIPELELLLRNICSKDEVDECRRALQAEQKIKNCFIMQNSRLKEYYKKIMDRK